MKKIFTLITATVLAISALAQSPEKMSYQAVIRNSNNQLVTNQAVGMRISIIQGTADGTEVYSETHTPTTNTNGLVGIEVGSGTTSDDFASITWINGPYFIKTETDPTGGSNYSIIGISQLLSVPYALHAKTAETLLNGITETDPLFSLSVASSITSNDVNNWNNSLTEITETDPLFATSAANSIKTSDIDNWNNKIGEITGNELPFTNWDKNISDDFDGNYNSLSNKPNFADSISNKAVMLTGDQVVDGNKTFTGAIHPYYIEVNSFGTGNRNAFIDFHGDDTYTDYSLRLARYNSGQSLLEHRGTNMMSIQTSDSADIRIATKGIQRMRIDANGNIIVNDLMRNYKTLRIYDQSNKTLFFRQDGDNSYISNKQNFLITGTPKNGWLHINGESGVILRVGKEGVAGTAIMQVDTLKNIDMLNNQVINVKTPVNDKDAANKAYVDVLERKIYILEDPTNRGLVSDVDGNTYKTIKIGAQVWMAENLKTTKYRNGTAIPKVTGNTEWNNLTTPGYCWYNNDEVNYKSTYGAMYNWYTVNTGNLCPTGWHVPSDAEWTTLTTYLGGTDIAGGKLKEKEYSHWLSPNLGATNESGFTALPGGYREKDGNYYYINSQGRWWSTTENMVTYAWFRMLIFNVSDIKRYDNEKNYGYSVRCVKG